MHGLILLLSLAGFGRDLAGLGADAFDAREAASARLAAALPWSWPAVRGGAESEDPEVARRCETLLNGSALTGPARDLEIIGLVLYPTWGRIDGAWLPPELDRYVRARTADYCRRALGLAARSGLWPDAGAWAVHCDEPAGRAALFAVLRQAARDRAPTPERMPGPREVRP